MIENGTVHIIDDDASLRRALERLFRSVGLPSRSYASPDDFLGTDEPQGPGCVVLDIRMPGINGLDFQQQMIGANIHLPVVVMSGYGDIAMSVRAMKAGALDFLAKPFRDQDMLDAIGMALETDRRRRAIQGETMRLAEIFKSLSPRERQVMRLVTSGKMNKQIAFEIGLSEITVKIHRRGVMRKTGAASLAELVRIADVLTLHRLDEDGGEPARAAAVPIASRRPATSMPPRRRQSMAMVA